MIKRKDTIMKVKNIFSSISLIFVMGLMLTACTQDEQNLSGDKPYKTENGFYVYPVDFQCAVPGYDDEGKTRAMSYNWNKNTSIFARFQSGSNYYYGFLTYGDNGWDLLSTNDFLEMTTTGTVELYYFKEANGDYYYLNLETQCLDVYNNGSFVKNTSTAWNSSSIDFSEGTAVYLTRSATYSKTGKAGNSGNFTINATLNPGLWRMRFSGTNGTSITMPAADNEILYLSSFNWYGSDNVSFSGGAKDISLKVSNNYTPYIYGQFTSTSNKITVKNGNDTFTRNLDGSNLYAGISGCFTIPTSSNYSSTGWTMTSNTITTAKGSGTDTDPYNVAAALNFTKALDADVVSENDIYVKGIISSIKFTYSAEYGTATYNISDDGSESSVFTVYGSYYYDNQPWVEGNEQINVGDEVIVVGKVIYYKGTTPEFSNKQNWLFSLNRNTSFVTATVAEFLAAAEDDTRYRLTGVISNLYYYKDNVAGFYIKDYTGETLVYKADGFTGTEAKVGDIVSAVGKRGSYKGTAQMTSGKFQLEHSVTPVTIAEFLSKPDDMNTYYMVTGTISSLLDSKGKENDFGNLYLTDGTNELYVYGCYAGWGATGDARKFFIAENGIQVGDELSIIGYKNTYNELVERCQGVCFSFKKAE